jgi:hypothetical protein
MAYTVNDSTDLEMTRYNEAADIKKYSGVSIDNVRGGYVQHDPIRKVEGVYIDLPSGGKLRVGDRPVQVAQADTMLTQTDATAAAPAALVPTATPAPVSLRPTAAPAAAPQTIAEYDAEIRSQGRVPQVGDFELGGYTPAEIATLSANPEMVPIKMTPAQTAEYAKQPDARLISDYEQPGFFDGAISETIKGLVRGGIVEPAKFVSQTLGETNRTLFQIVDPQTGEFDPQIRIVSAEEIANMEKMPFAPVALEELLKTDPQAGTGAQIAGGVGQFVGAFAGIGKLFKIGKGLLGATTQGAAADFLGFGGNDGRLTDVLLELGVPENRITDFLRTDPNDPDYVGRFKNALEGAVLGGLVDQIAPVFRLIKDGGSATALGQAIGDLRFKAQQTSSNFLSDAIGVGRAVAAGDTRMLGEIFQPAGTPRSLGAADVSPETATAITAFHGSPHDFDAFDLSKIGTGEGAQVYGRGLYFSEKEGVAKSYRDALSDPDALPLQFDGKPVNTPWNEEIRDRWPEYFSKLNEDDADAMEELLGNLSQVNNLADVKNVLDGISSRAKSLYQSVVKPKLVKPDVGQGSMYEVNIKADPAEFLDWDKPLNEQSAKVREVLMPFVEKRINQMGEAGKRFTTDEWMGRLRGGDVMLLDKDGDTPVSIALSDAGIPGIRYLDQNSRQGGKGTSNYVVLDDKLIDIVKKYGIAGLAVGAAVQSELGVNKQIEERTNGI